MQEQVQEQEQKQEQEQRKKSKIKNKNKNKRKHKNTNKKNYGNTKILPDFHIKQLSFPYRRSYVDLDLVFHSACCVLKCVLFLRGRGVMKPLAFMSALFLYNTAQRKSLDKLFTSVS